MKMFEMTAFISKKNGAFQGTNQVIIWEQDILLHAANANIDFQLLGELAFHFRRFMKILLKR